MTKGEIVSKIAKSVLECKRREPGTMQPEKVTASGSPWFLGGGKNLVVRK